MLRDGLQVRIYYDMRRDMFPAVIKEHTRAGDLCVGRVTMETVGPDNQILCYEPSFELRPEQAQQLLDDLWLAGVRPTNEGRQADVLKAHEGHISSLRESLAVLHDVVRAKLGRR